MPRPRLSRGFTLVEVLIALAITAFVSTIAYTSLSTVITGMERTREHLWEGRVEQAIASCREKEQSPGAAACVQRAITYFTNNKERMDYKRFREQGYQIGSGTVESACKQIGTQRLKRAGARWRAAGARYTAKARAAYLGGQMDSLVARKIHVAQAA